MRATDDKGPPPPRPDTRGREMPRPRLETSASRCPCPAALANNRLQIFDLEGKHLRVLHGDVRRPCNVYVHGDTSWSPTALAA
jgi:hypothetical protein